MSLIKSAGAGEQSTGFYKHLLDQSLKFNDGDTQYLTRTPASAGNRKTWTLSFWVKFSTIQAQTLFATRTNTNPFGEIRFESDGGFFFYGYTGSAYQYRFDTTQLFRDVSAWYHFVFAMDTTQSTEGNRTKIYVNGSQITAFDNEIYPTQNLDTNVNNAVEHDFGYDVNSTTQAFDGYLAEINFIDGTALTAASFGETKDGIWIPKDTSGLTFGTNGFHLTFKDDVVSEGFNTVTYSGNGGTQSISGLGFEQDGLVWIKRRDGTAGHQLYDSVRGATKRLQSDSTGAESTQSTGLTSFDSDGFSLGSLGGSNANNETFVAWCWEAGGAPTADNSAGAGATPTAGSVKIDGSNLGSALAGSIAATRLSANTSQGFSLVTFTGNGSAGATIAHGLSAAPECIILKSRDNARDWRVYHTSLGATKTLDLNKTTSEQGPNAAYWNNTAPTSSVFSVGSVTTVNGNGEDYIAYCWTPISGYSKFGSYTGNGGSNNAVTGLGFKPAWLMVKRTDTATTYSNWWIQDGTRNPTNVGNTLNIAADTTGGETNALEIDFDSDGFTLQDGSQGSNISGGTYIYMAFADTREAAFFKDVSTNGNHFTPVNLDYRDSVPDVPTNNFAVLNAVSKDSVTTLSEGNLKATSYNAGGAATIMPETGKYYWEVFLNDPYSSIYWGIHGITPSTGAYSPYSVGTSVYALGTTGGGLYVNGSLVTAHTTWANGDVIGLAFDADAMTLDVYRNGTQLGSSLSVSSGYYRPSYFLNGTSGDPATVTYNFGQDSSFAGNHATANSNADGNGHGSFAYAPPSGYLALCSQNLPTPDIIDGSEYFNTVLYTGDGNSTKSISGVGFSADWVWVKNRASTYDHALMDSVRGASAAYLSSNNTASESTYGNIYGDFTSFDSDGFSVAEGSDATYPDAAFNQSSEAYVAWNWKAGGAAVSNTDGSITSQVSANTTAGFSIVSYVANGTNTATVGHGLSIEPKMVIQKDRSAASDWLVYTDFVDGSDDYLLLNSTAAKGNAAGGSAATVFNSWDRASGNNMIAYCFHSVEGYSKVGSYTGNGNADGTFVYTGFRPAWVMVKTSSLGGQYWNIFDNVRDPFNDQNTQSLYPNVSDAEGTGNIDIDFLSNGMKMRDSGNNHNSSGHTYIFLAFADQPFKFANAR